MEFTQKEMNLINIALTHYIEASKMRGNDSEYAIEQRKLGNEIILKIENITA
jgi:small nuclear ribonucleoprotein (snRNP)-like protein